MMCLVIGMAAGENQKVQAASASITLAAVTEPIQKGDLFSISVTLKSSSQIGEVNAKIKYDTNCLQFSTENSIYNENDGVITVTDTVAEASKTKKYILQFRANEAKTARIWVEGTPQIYDADGNILSVSKNVLSFSVGEKTEKSSNKNLSSLAIKEGRLDQAFSKSNTSYTMTVPNEVKNITVIATPEEAKSQVKITGADKLLVGENKVVITVTSETKRTKEYTIVVTRTATSSNGAAVTAGPEETKNPEKDSADVAVTQPSASPSSKEEKKSEGLGQYEFVSLDNMRLLPSGYLSVPLEIDEKRVDAYQLENQADKDLFLVYAKFDGGSPSFYLYDQKEGTIQRYVEVQGQSKQLEETVSVSVYNSKVEMFGIIVGVCVGIIGLLVILLIRLYRKSKGYQRDFD